jgi:hypothetical protein
MRHTTLILTLILVGCAAELTDESDDEESNDDGDVSSAAETHNPDNCPGGSGGGGDPGPQPERKRCLPSNPDEICLDCCWYNHNHVDGWKCRRIKNPKKREACWKRAADELGRCQREDCDRYGPITTIQVQ